MSHRILSGMRPTGYLHLGHYHGVLKNWLTLQQSHECFFFVADWHAFTTHYEHRFPLAQWTIDMVVDWLSVGINPNNATIFTQSSVKEHAELHLLLSMSTPLSWLERTPSYKDIQNNLTNKDLKTYGFLGYPLLQSADILMYKATQVPVGADQVAHIELTREIARRFNHIYGQEEGFNQKIAVAIKKMGKKSAKRYLDYRKAFQEQGDKEGLTKAQSLLNEQQNITLNDKERLMGYLEGSSRAILLEPEVKLTSIEKMPGLDGRKMSKSYNNIISLRDAPDIVEQKIKQMPTDPARIKRTDPGSPEKCPVWGWHQIYTSNTERKNLYAGCQSASIGCVDCKMVLVEQVNAELAPIIKQRHAYEDINLVKKILYEGAQSATIVARKTMSEVRQIMGIE